MERIETSIVINRPAEEVFAYAVDPNNATKWQEGILESAFTSPEPVQVGSKYRYVAKFMGQRFETSGDVTAWEPPRLYAWKSTSAPFPNAGSQAFETVEGGTRVTYRMEAEPSGFFKLAEPLLRRTMQGQMEAELRKLKQILEARA